MQLKSQIMPVWPRPAEFSQAMKFSYACGKQASKSSFTFAEPNLTFKAVNRGNFVNSEPTYFW